MRKVFFYAPGHIFSVHQLMGYGAIDVCEVQPQHQQLPLVLQGFSGQLSGHALFSRHPGTSGIPPFGTEVSMWHPSPQATQLLAEREDHCRSVAHGIWGFCRLYSSNLNLSAARGPTMGVISLSPTLR